MVGGGNFLDERGEELRLRVDHWFQSREASDAGLRVAVRGIANNGCEDRHGAAIDIDEGLRDHEVDYLSTKLDSRMRLWLTFTYPDYQIIRDVVPALVQIQKPCQRRETICERISRGMQCQESQLGKPSLVYEDICERGVPYGTLQLEHGHLSHRLLIRAQSRDQFGDIDAVHAAKISGQSSQKIRQVQGNHERITVTL